MSLRVKLIVKIGFILILVAGFAAYGVYKAQGFLNGPRLIIEQPQDGQIVQNSNISVEGKAKNISSIFLNGGQIFTNENGEFKENLLLARGYNIIEVKAVDKFNREIKVNRKIILK